VKTIAAVGETPDAFRAGTTEVMVGVAAAFQHGTSIAVDKTSDQTNGKYDVQRCLFIRWFSG